tara:strand:- start:25 stop:330 length:306 start_codon:yes stop_codon:yes gene_type:complete
MSDLFDWQPPIGKTDTSEEAAMKISPFAKTLRDKTYWSINEKPSTTSEIARSLNKNYSGIQPRTSELKAHGYIRDTGTRRLNEWGNNEIVWGLTDKETKEI